MKRPRHFCRWSLMLVLAMGLARADEPKDPKDPARKITFPAALETKFTKFLGQASEVQRKFWHHRMEEQIQLVAKTTGLDAAGQEALRAPARAAVDLSMKAWLTKSEATYRSMFEGQTDELRQFIDQSLSEIAALGDKAAETSALDFDGENPLAHPTWLAALQKSLSVNQAAAWAKYEAEQKNVLDKEAGDLLLDLQETARAQFSGPIMEHAADIKATLGLPKDRAEKLDELVKAAIEQSAKAWRENAQKLLLMTDERQRKEIIKNRSLSLVPEEKDLPEEQPIWKEGLNKILLTEELSRLSTSDRERKSRRVRLLADLLLAELDERVNFSASQRKLLTPLAERLIRDVPALVGADGEMRLDSFGRQGLIECGTRAEAEELKTILDDTQMRRWREACSQPNGLNAMNGGMVVDPGLDLNAHPAVSEPEAIEHGISDFLFEKAVQKRKAMLVEMSLQQEDLARLTEIDGPSLGRLQSAARGAVEECLAAWRAEMDQLAHSNTPNATTRNIRQLLNGLENYQGSAGSRNKPEERPVWKNAVRTELTPEQQNFWRSEVAARSAFRDYAISASVLSGFDEKVSLNSRQWSLLQPIVVKVIRDYRQDIGRLFGFPGGAPWYLQNMSRLIPIAGIPEAKMKTILTNEQWDRWTGCAEFGNNVNYWTMIEQNHQAREE